MMPTLVSSSQIFHLFQLIYRFLCRQQDLYQPADERCDDDTPGRAAAVGVGLLLIFVPSAAQKNGVEEQEEKVQSQTGERHTSQ